MLDGIEALGALVQHGTMTRAATALRLTQSAVSKRIHTLETWLGSAVVEPVGRRVRVTPAGLRLLERAGPLLADLRAVLADRAPPLGGEGSVAIGVSESILASWGARLLAEAQRQSPGVSLDVHAHRSPVVIDGVLAGEFALGLVAGGQERSIDLVRHALPEEAMVIVPSGLVPLRLRRGASLEVLSIESSSATGRALARRLRSFQRASEVTLVLTRTLQSFACMVQLARAGFGHALVPEGIALAMGLAPDQLTHLPQPGLQRPVHLIGRRGTLGRPLIGRVLEALVATARQVTPSA